MNDKLQLSSWQRFRTLLHLFQTGVRKRLTVGVRAILLEEAKVLLIRHTYLPGWQFPGGGVEPGETAEEAAARETLEETGCEPVGRPTLHGLFLNRIAGGSRDHVAVYVWREYRRAREFEPNFEIAECRWFDVDDLLPDIEPGTARRIREVVSNIPSEAEW